MPDEIDQKTNPLLIDEPLTLPDDKNDTNQKKIHCIPISEIDPFPKHPFHVSEDEDMKALVDSIRMNGVLTPAAVRKKEDGRYELLSGHRRKRACEIAGLSTLPCKIVELNQDEAVIFMVDSNLQRTEILPSEKVFSYKRNGTSEGRINYSGWCGKRISRSQQPAWKILSILPTEDWIRGKCSALLHAVI